MRTFELYVHPLQGVKAVKLGWSWPGFFLAPVWALVKHLWAWAALLWLVFIVFAVGGEILQREGVYGAGVVSGLFTLAASLFTGARGNAWRAAHLLSRGFTWHRQVEAETVEAALAMGPYRPGPS